MCKRVVALLLLVALLGLSSYSAAEPKNKAEAKAELEKLKGVMKFSKEHVIPLINCYVENQQYLLNMYGDYPNRGKERVSKIELCISQHSATTKDDAKLMELKNKMLNLMKIAVTEGGKICDIYHKYNNTKDKLTGKAAKDEPVKRDMDDLKKQIESMKQQIYNHTSEFTNVRKEFLDWQKKFLEYYKQVQLKAR